AGLLQQLQKETAEECSLNRASSSSIALSGGQSEAWIHALTHTDRMIIHIARAVVANPSVLVLHRPLMRFFSHEQRERVMTMLKDYVKHRGVGFPAGDVQHRRPRTVFFSSCHADEAKEADIVWHLQEGKVHLESSKLPGK
ncbi:unnamed protein product, partial [Polarella glacialis]